MAPKKKLVSLEAAKAKLHTAEVPDKLVKREEECQEIRNFILSAIRQSREGGCEGRDQALYISGVPGSGKTASVQKVVKSLQATKEGARFKFVEINGLELSDPKKLFGQVYAKVTNDTRNISQMNAQCRLNALFSAPEQQQLPLILMVDELDMICTRKQEVLYALLNWTAYPGSRVFVIAISNTLDLPERILSKRISSRLGTNRLCFQPYEHREIEEIISYRLGEFACNAVDSKAIQLAARKVAAFSGDLRKALELLRRAIEIALEEAEGNGTPATAAKLTFHHVNRAMQEASSQIRAELCLSMSQHEDLLFRTLVKDLELSGLEETHFSRFFYDYKVMCKAQCAEPLSSSAAFRLLMELASTNLVSLSPDSGEMKRRIRLGMSLTEAQFCVSQMDENLKKSPDVEMMPVTNTPSKAMAQLRLGIE